MQEATQSGALRGKPKFRSRRFQDDAMVMNETFVIRNNKNQETVNTMPSTWPCQWQHGVIPFAFDFFALSPKRMISLVRKAHTYIEARSCLVFKERNPVESARRKNFTYLFYSYSEVLESCCLPFFTKSTGRRLVLITPLCSLQTEVAHATLHALGLSHRKYDAFPDLKTRAILFPKECVDLEHKIAQLNDVNI